MCVKTKKYNVSVSFCPKLVIFGNRSPTTTDFERKFEFFKTHKNSYTGPFCITYLGYGCQNQEILSFSQFMAKQAIFVKTVV
jgi:hypothetical protein